MVGASRGRQLGTDVTAFWCLQAPGSAILQAWFPSKLIITESFLQPLDVWELPCPIQTNSMILTVHLRWLISVVDLTTSGIS